VHKIKNPAAFIIIRNDISEEQNNTLLNMLVSVFEEKRFLDLINPALVNELLISY
jgi:hypothetical protein